ncbi:MAG: hypothetical protein ABS75_27400 [Pelagibacterium sp. SCN 63-23]|nr:MAG: hypothetical protein ABS75_27400 [Pelagibacterium sp. SCN 63-23]
MKVLIVARNASSRFGGEAFLPLKYFQILRRRGYPAQLIAHARNRDDLKESLAEWIEHVHFVEDSWLHRTIWRAGSLMPATIRDHVFGVVFNFIDELYQAKIIRRLVRTGSVDIIHQPIPVSPRAPSGIYGFGVPVVIGPMNGNMDFPPGYDDYAGQSERLFKRFGRWVAIGAGRLVPGKRKAALLLVANERTLKGLPLEHGNVQLLVENGVDFSVFSRPEHRPHGTPGKLRLIFLGRLVSWKGLDFTLRAVALARGAGLDVALDIVGEGDEAERLKILGDELGLGDQVRWHGFLPQQQCAAMLASCDVLILNSLYECGGAVILEAMSQGLPVIASDWGGPADYVDPDCGILVSPMPRDSFAERLSAAIAALAADPELRQTLGNAAALKVRAAYDWEHKVDHMIEHYLAVLPARHANNADGPPPVSVR